MLASSTQLTPAWRSLLTSLNILRRPFQRARVFRFAWWTMVVLTVLKGLSLLFGFGEPAVASLLGFLNAQVWLCCLAALARFSVPAAAQRAGIGLLALRRANAVAGFAHSQAQFASLLLLWLPATVFVFLVAMMRAGGAEAVSLVLALPWVIFVQIATAVMLTALSALAERAAPRQPVTFLALLFVVPEMLRPAIPELPGAVHYAQHWLSAAVGA